MSTLVINNLHVQVETGNGPKEILKGVNLTINSGEIHAIMVLHRKEESCLYRRLQTLQGRLRHQA